MKFCARFSLTIPSDAAKKAKTFLMKYCSLSFNLAQSDKSASKSISSAVQKFASDFL